MKSRTFHVRDKRFWTRLASCKTPPRLYANDNRFPAIGEFLRGEWPDSEEHFVIACTINHISVIEQRLIEFRVDGADQPIVMRSWGMEKSPRVSWFLYGREGDPDWAAIYYSGSPDGVLLVQHCESVGGPRGDRCQESGSLSWQWIRTWLTALDVPRDHSGSFRFPVNVDRHDARTIVLHCSPALDKMREIFSDALAFRDLDHLDRPEATITPTEEGP